MGKLGDQLEGNFGKTGNPGACRSVRSLQAPRAAAVRPPGQSTGGRVGPCPSLCSPAFTATQYALLSSLAAVGRTLVASSGGLLAERLGWVPFFLLTTVATLPALLLLVWIAHNGGAQEERSGPRGAPPRARLFRP